MARTPRRRTSADPTTFTDRLIGAINEKVPDSARRLGTSIIASDVVGYISTQSIAIDYAIGRPGIPVGRITLVVGPEGGGKSTLVYHLLAEVQRLGGVAALADTESRFDRERAARIGINLDEIVWIDTSTLEDTVKAIDKLVEFARSELPDVPILVAWDSIAATPTEQELEGEVGEPARIGGHAKAISGVMRRWARRMARHRIAVVMVNQLRESLEILKGGGAVGGKTMIAEHPLGYHSSLTIWVTQARKEGANKEEPDAILSRFYMAKNTVAPPFRSALTRICFADGFDRDDAKLRVAERLGWLGKSGSWYHYPPEAGPDQVKFQRSDWSKVLEEHPELDEAFASLLRPTGAVPQGVEEEPVEVEEEAE